MLRVQLNMGDRQSPSQQQQQQHQQQQQLAPRPLFQYNAATSFDNSDSATAARPRERSNSGQQLKRSLPHSSSPHSGQSAGMPMRPSHSAKGRKVRGSSGAHAAATTMGTSSTLSSSSSTPSPSASSSSGAATTSNNNNNNNSTSTTSATNTPIAAGSGRKVLKQEVTQLQHIVDGMQQQVQAATREIQALRSMVGRMADANTQHKLAQLASQQSEQLNQQQQLRDQELLQYELYEPQHQQHTYEQQHQQLVQNYHTPHTHQQQQSQPQSPLVAPPQEELQALALLHAPLMDIYQFHHSNSHTHTHNRTHSHHSNAGTNHSGGFGAGFAPPGLTDAEQSELVDHFAATFHTASDGHSTSTGTDADTDATTIGHTNDDALASIDSLGFDCRMEQALLCDDDDDDYPLFFES